MFAWDQHIEGYVSLHNTHIGIFVYSFDRYYWFVVENTFLTNHAGKLASHVAESCCQDKWNLQYELSRDGCCWRGFSGYKDYCFQLLNLSYLFLIYIFCCLVDEHGMDFDKYGILIKVKFRLVSYLGKLPSSIYGWHLSWFSKKYYKRFNLQEIPVKQKLTMAKKSFVLVNLFENMILKHVFYQSTFVLLDCITYITLISCYICLVLYGVWNKLVGCDLDSCIFIKKE